MPALTPDIRQNIVACPAHFIKRQRSPGGHRIGGSSVYTLGLGALGKRSIPSKFDHPVRDVVKIMINACQLTKIMKK